MFVAMVTSLRALSHSVFIINSSFMCALSLLFLIFSLVCENNVNRKSVKIGMHFFFLVIIPRI